MPPRKSRDKEVQPAQAEHADDSPLHSEGENDPITFLPVSPLAERSYGNPVFKEKEADRGGDFTESSNVFRGMTEHLDLAFKEQNQAMRRLVDSQAESSRHQEELIGQCIEDMRQVFEEGTRVMQETGEESRRTLQAVSEQVVEQVRQPRLEIPPPVQNFFMGEGQRQHEPMEAVAPVANHGHQPQHRYIPPSRRGNVGPHHQPYPRDFFQPQVPPAQPIQHGLQNQPAQLFNRDQLIDLVQETYGPALRPLVHPAYRKPYPDVIDHENPSPRGFKVPEFTLFSGEVGQSTIEHIGRFTIQCGEASGDDNLKLRLFPSSLTGTALTCVYGRLVEEFVKLAQNGLDIELRKKFEGMEFRDFYELSYKVARYENLLKEDVQKKAASHGTYYSDPNFDLDVAEVVTDKPVVCLDLVRPTHQPETSVRHYVGKVGKQYTFDVLKASDIFDYLKESGLIKLPPGHKIPTAAEIGARDYCKFHNSWKHSTDNCLIFHNVLQEKIDKGILKFPNKAKETMGVDADPFPTVSVGVNDANLRSVARNRSLHYAQRNLATKDLRWVLEAQRSRHSRSVKSNQQRLGGQGRIIVTRSFSPESTRPHSEGTKPPRMVKPPLRSPSRQWEKVSHPKFLTQNPRTLRRRLQRKKAEERKRQQKQTEAEGSSSRRPRQPTKRNMVWVASIIVSPDGVLKATFEAQEQFENRGAESKEDGTIHFGEFLVNLSCLVLTLPLVFQAKKEKEPIICEFPEQIEEEVIIVPAQDDEEEDMADKIVRVLVDNGAAVNVFPTCKLYKIGKSRDDLVHTEVTIMGNKTLMFAFFVVDTVATYNALLGRDWIHSSWCVPSSLHQKLIFWNGGKVEVVSADDKPFSANTHLVEARYYEEDIGKRKAMLEITKKLAAYFAEKAVQVDRSEIVHEGEEADQGDEITLEELDLAPAKLDDLKAEVQDPLEEINLGFESEPKDYLEMPGLDHKLVEHKLPIAEGFRSYKQPPRRMSAEATLKVKEEIERLVNAGFIRTCRYAEWLSNVMHVLKKNGKLRVCVDFRNLNLATPKDEYPMPIADLLVDGVALHKILSFMDGHSGYNQIFITDADVPKTAFRCPVKSHGEADRLVHLKKAFERMRQHGLKMNPLKCAFGVSAGNFLGYLVHERGLEVDKNKARAVIKVKPPQNKKELQRFLGQLNFLRRFISNLAGKTRAFSPLLKLKSEADFKWEEHHQSAFDMIKRTKTMSGAGVVVISPSGLKTQMSFQLDFDCTNNQAEYEALIIGLEMLVELKVSMVEVIGDSQLVLKQLSGEYKCTSLALAPYFALAVQLLEEFDDVSIRHVPKDQNYEANEMAQIALGKAMMNYCYVVWVQMKVSKCCLMSMMGFVGCKSYQIYGPLQRVLASELNSIVKPWPFRGWAIDLIGKVYPPSSKGHSFIIVATDYFTKWVEAKPMKKVDQYDVIKFIKEDIIHRFGLLETITTDQGTVFVSHQVEAFAKEMGFHLLNSTPHYAQANGQAEASNKVVINLLEKMVDDNPRRWHELLEYDEAMMLELEDLEDTRLAALDRLQAQKLKIAKSYNKRVKGKNLAVGDLVWKAILPLGKKDHRFGKWSPNWDGPFQIHEVLRGGAYWLESLDGELHPRKINGIYLKPYYPTVWEARGLKSPEAV
ncbi:hypothetical protein SLEP1_g10860 [Rubroshorea leprosula]|uniref:Uncharacterized protein n=1 Tax=Rubroshorea leprosula TaxID=152421 RepID=A0AAV5IIQ8_9ROSI|nr:hypothetical protein SLEP1_g10860 [Rubroshorea leprosula]